MNPFRRALAATTLLVLSALPLVQAQPQTPITVQIINDSGLPDSAINLLVVGKDVGNTPSGSPGTYYPFNVGGVAATPVGVVTNTNTPLSLRSGSISATNGPLVITATDSPLLMTFSPATIAVSTGASTLSITLPDVGTLVQPFTVPLPDGVTVTADTYTGNCPVALLTFTSFQISIAAGQTIPAGGCTIAIGVTGAALGAVDVWTSYLQGNADIAPGVAALNVVPATQGLVASTFTPVRLAVGTGNNATLSIFLPNPGNAQTLTAPFISTMPDSIQVVPPYAYTSSCAGQVVTVTATQVSLPMNAPLPPGGCTITVTVTSVATSEPLQYLAKTGAQITSPYTGNPLPIRSFTMSTVSSGSLYVSYNQPLTYPSAPSVRTPTRFQPVEFSYSNGIASNGDLTSIDFYGIPLELQTFAPADTAQAYPLDRVTYYTSTQTLLQRFTDTDSNLAYAFIGTDGNTFVPTYDAAGNITNFASFARVVGPNQVAAGGTPPVIQYPATKPANWNTAWPPASGSPWPYGSFADYLDSLVGSNYTFNEADDVNISAYNFNYTGSISGNRNAGYTITLTGTTGAPLPPSPLPTSATITLVLPRQSTTGGGYDFAIYGVPQNCNTLQVSGFTCVPATAAIPAQNGKPAIPANPGNVNLLTNSVYGWIQADVISALNFGYLRGSADYANGGGKSGVWYGVPPVQYPFGLARPNPNNGNGDDGFYNAWAALMYNNSDAYGFAFSDRKGRPSPDISFPIGGTLRIWILPDQRLDAPVASVTATQEKSITVQWAAIANATSYVVTYSPPYQTASITVPQSAAVGGVFTTQITGLTPGTPYTISVRAMGSNTAQQAIQSFELPVYASTQGAEPTPSAGNVAVQLGFNWLPPAYMTAGVASTWPTLQIAGQTGTYSGSKGKFDIPGLTSISVGPSPASAGLTVTSDAGSPALYVNETISTATTAGTGGSATLTLLLGNNTGAAVAMPNGLVVDLPAGVQATQTPQQVTATTCAGATTQPASGGNPSTVVMGGASIAAGGCTIVATLTAATTGTFIVTVPPMVVPGQTSSLVASAPFVVPTANALITMAVYPASIGPGDQSQLTITLGNATGSAAPLVEPFIMSMPGGVTVVTPAGGSTGSCTPSAVQITPNHIVVPATTAIPAAGCTIVVNVTSQQTGSTTLTSGTVLTTYPTQSFPVELAYGGNTIWSANLYLTMMGTPTSYSVGPCQPGNHCIGSGLQNIVPWDTLLAPNFMERQGVGLTVSGGAQIAGPPFGGAGYQAGVGISLTPVANKQYAPVRMPY